MYLKVSVHQLNWNSIELNNIDIVLFPANFTGCIRLEISINKTVPKNWAFQVPRIRWCHSDMCNEFCSCIQVHEVYKPRRWSL